jgi:hypothetical protein
MSGPLNCLIIYKTEVWITFEAVSTYLNVARLRYLVLSSLFFFLVLCLHLISGRYAVDCASCVRLPCDHPRDARHLRKFGRIAIWNMRRIVIIIAMGVWVTDVSLLIHGKCFLHIMEGSLLIPVISQVSYG